MSVEIICIPSGPFATNTYVLYSTSEDFAVVIDPAPHCAKKVFEILHKTKKTISAIWLTHSHWDHTAGYKELCHGDLLPLIVHECDAENLLHPGSDGIPSFVPVSPTHPTKFLQGGEILKTAQNEWTVLHTPGHSMGSVCFYCANEQIIFTGDTLFKGTYGNVSFPKSSPQLMSESLQHLTLLPPSTRIYPGHGPTTLLCDELPWMRQYSQDR